MPIAAEHLEDILRQKFPHATIAIKDLVGDQDHYEVALTDASFAGKNRLMQHRAVHEALKGTPAEDLHALTLKTGARVIL